MSLKNYNRRHFVQTSLLASLGIGLTKNVFPSSSLNLNNGKRIGIIGLDGSHAVAFTKVINAKDASPEYLGYKVVAAYPRGSLDIESSVSRVPRYTRQIKELGVKIVVSIPELLDKVDVVFMVTNDGRRHLEQALPVFKAGKRMFIDKPLAASLKDGIDIFAAAAHYNVPVYSGSNDRFLTMNHPKLVGSSVGKVIGADVHGPSPIEETHPTLFWYGIHSVETLFTIMGAGCKSVVRVFNKDADITVGTWSDNRLGVNRAMRVGPRDRGGTIYGEEGIISFERDASVNENNVFSPYKAMIEFFESGVSPVNSEETLEILAFMEAADESKFKGGKEVKIETVMQRAKNSKDRLKLESKLE